MRKRIVSVAPIVVAAAAIVLVAASVARADETLVDVNVPFAFMVTGVQLPAGDYVVRQISEDGQVLQIVSADGRHAAFTSTIPLSELAQPHTGELVFEEFGSVHFLSRVIPADGNDREIVLTPALMEREIMKSRQHAAN